MVMLNENFVVDKDGHKIGVFLDMKTYEHILDDLEEIEDIRAYDDAKSSRDEAIPFDLAVREIRQKYESGNML